MEMKLNKPLANTYGWLRVNGTKVNASVGAVAQLREEIPEGVLAVWREEDAFSQIKTGAGPDTAALLRGVRTRSYSLGPSAQPQEPLRVEIDFDAADAGAGFSFSLAENSRLTVIMNARGGRGTAAVVTKADLGRGAVLRLVQIQRTGDEALFINDLGGRCGENARVEWTRLILEGRETYDGCSVALEGNGSGLTVNAGYRLGGQDRLDMNYEAVHTGKKTQSEIKAAGVLSGKAFKLLRGTIDLRRGCAGAVGNETEDVLLMDETVRNQTVPVILCAEEDVVGNHGASIGRLDEALIFYLESRGMTREAVYDMMARAKVDAVIRRIPDEKTIRELIPEEQEETP